jgi:hypothetical protein
LGGCRLHAPNGDEASREGPQPVAAARLPPCLP